LKEDFRREHVGLAVKLVSNVGIQTQLAVLDDRIHLALPGKQAVCGFVEPHKGLLDELECSINEYKSTGSVKEADDLGGSSFERTLRLSAEASENSFLRARLVAVGTASVSMEI
jgi:hypothetical protein